jgi:hypothetical protein
MAIAGLKESVTDYQFNMMIVVLRLKDNLLIPAAKISNVL